ncbi:MAG: hypothetical protein Q4D38_10945 [Planctomycetia bacterium]|nr:hypothetical protein [Planctomycetia bacterium]
MKLNFALARRLQEWDFSKISDTPFHIMVPQKTNFSALYFDYSLIAAIAFAIVWERKKMAYPDKIFTLEEQKAEENKFLELLDGQALEDAQRALWNAFCDFFRALATDLQRIAFAAQTAKEEGEKMNESIRTMIQAEAQSQLSLAKTMLHKVGGTSGESADSSDGVGGS